MINMQKTIISLSIILIGSIVANTSHAWTQAGKFRDWGVAVNDKNCAAWTVSKKSNTQAEIFVLFAKGQNTADVHFKIPNLLSKYQLKKVKLEVLGAKYNYQLNITEPSIASSTPANKKSIISAFRKGSDVKSNWSINDRKNRSSSFSLMGFTAAFLKAAEKCGAEKFALTTAPGKQTNTKKIANKYKIPVQFIQNELSNWTVYEKTIISRVLTDHTNFNDNLYLKSLDPNTISSFIEYSQKFIASDNAFHLINSEDSAERFLMSFLDVAEQEKKAKEEKLEREKQEKLEREKKAKLEREKKEELEKLEREKTVKEAFLRLSQTQRIEIIEQFKSDFYYNGPANGDWDVSIISHLNTFYTQMTIMNAGDNFESLVSSNKIDESLIKVLNNIEMRNKRIEKAKQEKLEREKPIRDAFTEKLKAHELMLTDKNRIGFRDFYIGMDVNIHTYIKYGNVKIENINFKNKDGEKCILITRVKPRGLSCYGLDYRFEFDTGPYAKSELNQIRVYVLNYVQSSSYIGNLFNMGTSEDPVVNLINSLNKKYKKSYSYSENERLLFNDGETDELYIAYEDGQVIFSLERVDDGSYDTDIYAYITYRNKSDGLKFLDAIKPKTAISDF